VLDVVQAHEADALLVAHKFHRGVCSPHEAVPHSIEPRRKWRRYMALQTSSSNILFVFATNRYPPQQQIYRTGCGGKMYRAAVPVIQE
jgi:hypothetical protein